MNFLQRVPLLPTQRLDSRPLGRLPESSLLSARGVLVLSEAELAGGKLTALLARHTARDVFDAYGLLSNHARIGEPLPIGDLRLCFVVYGAMSRLDWREASASSITLVADEARRMLLPLLRAESFPEAATDDGSASATSATVESWVGELVAGCRAGVAPLLEFTSSERAFLDRLLDVGEIHGELLTDDEQIAGRIGRHPALLWKAQHVRQRAAGRG